MGGEELNAPVDPAETVTAGPEGAEKRGKTRAGARSEKEIPLSKAARECVWLG
jgi:hypothetical protein